MLKNLQRIQNCVYNAFEKVIYTHNYDAVILVDAWNEDKGVRVYWSIIGTHPQHGVYLLKNARTYQDVYAHAYKALTDIMRPYFKK